jgi:hypothetical protein
MSGIFVAKGMSITIPAGGLRLSSTGAHNVNAQVSFDVCPSWLEIALDHLKAAKICNAIRREAWQGDDAAAKGTALACEFKASMQAITAAAIAIESFYLTLRSKVKIKKSKKNEPRYAQISEACAVAFDLKPKGTELLRAQLKQLFELRNKAVHPPSSPADAFLHPELKVGVEWRFIAFRFENALPLVRAAVSIVAELSATGRPSTEEVKKYADYLKPQLDLFLAEEILSNYSANPPTD